jgi:hypothetical protein
MRISLAAGEVGVSIGSILGSSAARERSDGCQGAEMEHQQAQASSSAT